MRFVVLSRAIFFLAILCPRASLLLLSFHGNRRLYIRMLLIFLHLHCSVALPVTAVLCGRQLPMLYLYALSSFCVTTLEGCLLHLRVDTFCKASDRSFWRKCSFLLDSFLSNKCLFPRKKRIVSC